MRCEYGFCLLCEKDVMVSCGTCGHKKHGNNYTEVLLDLSNGSKMPIAVCLECKDKVSHADKSDIMKAVRAGWQKELDAMDWSKEQREAYWKTHGDALQIL